MPDGQLKSLSPVSQSVSPVSRLVSYFIPVIKVVSQAVQSLYSAITVSQSLSLSVSQFGQLSYPSQLGNQLSNSVSI